MITGEADYSVDIPILETRGQAHFGSGLEPGLESRLQTAAANCRQYGRLDAPPEGSKAACPEPVGYAVDAVQVSLLPRQSPTRSGPGLSGAYQGFIQGGFAHDWSILEAKSSDWSVVRGPARSFVYALEALASIRLRRSDCGEAASILLVLQRLDPQDQVGAKVVRDLLAWVQEDCIDE